MSTEAIAAAIAAAEASQADLHVEHCPQCQAEIQIPLAVLRDVAAAESQVAGFSQSLELASPVLQPAPAAAKKSAAKKTAPKGKAKMIEVGSRIKQAIQARLSEVFGIAKSDGTRYGPKTGKTHVMWPALVTVEVDPFSLHTDAQKKDLLDPRFVAQLTRATGCTVYGIDRMLDGQSETKGVWYVALLQPLLPALPARPAQEPEKAKSVKKPAAKKTVSKPKAKRKAKKK
jgi:hypothetical protein